MWLKARPQDHVDRVVGQGDERPMAGRRDAMAELKAILAAREPLYRQADLTVDTSGRELDLSGAELVRELVAEGWSAGPIDRGPAD